VSDVICSNCGHRNGEGSNFCSSCGQALERVEEQTATITFTPDASSAGDEVLVEVPPAPATGMLIVTRGPNTGSEFVLEHVITTAGRHPDSDIFLDDVTVSRRHVEIERSPSGWIVRDVGSLNGTYLNGDRIDGDAPIHNGDELQVGKFKLIFVAGQGG
jgi:pSer/pThr/pTyr-binding forkhead associated (FHA) protein